MSTPNLGAIKDPAAREVMFKLYDRLNDLERRGNATPTVAAPTATVSGGDTARVINVADPTDGTDAVNKRSLRTAVNTAFDLALQRLGIRDRRTPPSTRPGVGAGILLSAG